MNGTEIAMDRTTELRQQLGFDAAYEIALCMNRYSYYRLQPLGMSMGGTPRCENAAEVENVFERHFKSEWEGKLSKKEKKLVGHIWPDVYKADYKRYTDEFFRIFKLELGELEFLRRDR